MSRRNRDTDSRDTRQPERSSGGGALLPPSLVRLLTLAGVGVLIFMNVQIWSQTSSFNKTIGQLDSRVAALGTKVDNFAAKAAQPPRQGPDPNKVYPVKTQGSPAEGPENAPVTIAEFSDFQ